MLLTLSILFLTAHSIIIDPINQTCIETSSYSIEYSNQLETKLPLFNLPPFSESIIQIDLRHLVQIPKSAQNQSLFDLKAFIIQSEMGQVSLISDIQASTNRYIFYVDQFTKLGLYFQIRDGYQAYKYLLFGSVSIRVIRENQRLPDQTQSFLFVISSLKNLNLPTNRPAVTTYSGYYIDKIISTSVSSGQSVLQSANSYWTTFNTLAIPFIPYISNCKGESRRMYLNQLMESQKDCDLVAIEDTVPIDQFHFGSSPTADTCKIKRQCTYDQVPGISAQFPYWLTLPEGSVLFSITQNQVKYEDYQINMKFDDNNLVQCKINESKGTNSTSQYPLNVKLTLQYYQQSQQRKKMISCTVSFSLYLQSSADFNYQFELQTKPLNHTYIMLAFGFEWYVYMIVFVIIGLISNFQNLVLWLFHSCVSGKEKKEFRIAIYLRVIFQIGKGTLIALVFSLVLLFSVNIIMNGKIFEKTLYSSDLSSSVPRVFWDYLNSNYINNYDSPMAVKYRSGRMGLSFFVVGSVILFYTSKFFIGCEKKKKDYDSYQILGRELKPREWNRGKFLFGTYVYICMQFFFIYFAYSATYSKNIWTFIVLMKIIQIIMQQITLSIYEDSLPCLPLKVITDITAYMNTLSADNLYDFLFSFLIDVAITMIEKAYVPQLQNIVVDKIHQKMNQLFRFYAHLINDTDGEINQAVTQEVKEGEEENQFVLMNGQTDQIKFFDNQQIQCYNSDSEIDLKLPQTTPTQKQISQKLLQIRRYQTRQYNTNSSAQPQQLPNIDKTKQQKMQQSSIIFQILLDNVLLLFTFLLQPFVVLVFWITYDQSLILSNYGISLGVVILYLLSAIVIAVFTIINMIMIFHLLQCYLQVDFDHIITKLLNRFFNRKVFWKASDQDINNQIHVAFRGADHYCLSWQFFFILAIYVSSMILVMLGVSIMMSSQYNPFNDAATSLVVLFWCIFTISSIWLIQKLGYHLNIDDWRNFDENSQNINAIVDLSVKEEINLKINTDQGTNHQLVISQNSNQELGGSSLMLRKSRKNSGGAEDNVNMDVDSNKFYIAEYEQNEDQSSQSSELTQQTLTTKIQTICKKLQPKFTTQKFNLQYFQKNKTFLKQNIDRILPLLDQLPQINEYKVPTSEIADLNGKKENKTYDFFIQEVINVWKNKSEALRRDRQKFGKDLEQGLVSCSFCFQPWGIYYGHHNGVCLKCSKLLTRKAKHQ